MKFDKIIPYTIKPELYEKGTAVMWTDKYISKQLLQVHLNTQLDLASRKPETITNTINWMLEQTQGEKLKILDLGCGPGLYSTQLAKRGHEVTGIDFSENSIAYAKQEANKANLNIEYMRANYLELDLPESSFDLVILVFTDLGVLLPEERNKIIRFVHKILKPGGTFIFDVLNDKELAQKISPKNWEAAKQGFWKPESYLALSESFLYENEKVILYQHVLIDEKENIDVYRFWTHFFVHTDLQKILNEHGFDDFTFSENVLPEGDLFSGEHVTFCVARK